jgi:AcrR family transcriptional regulator
MKDAVAAEEDKPRTNAELREEAVRRMLETAITMIAEGGVGKLSLVDVGRRAGYSHSLPNYYFKSKSRLLVDVYDFIIRRARGRISAFAKANTPHRIRPGLQNVLATVQAYLRLSEVDLTTAKAMNAIVSEGVSSMPDVLPAVRAQNQLLQDFFEAEIRQGITRGEIDPDLDVEALALMICALLRGAVGQWRLDPERVDFDRLARTVCLVLSRAVARPPG